MLPSQSKSRQAMRLVTNFFEGCNVRDVDTPTCLGNQVIDQRIEHALQRFIEDQLGGRVGILGSHGHVESLEELHVPANVIEIENLGFHAVIEIGREIGNLVGEIDDLRF